MLEIDKDFESLIPQLKREEFEKLEENILRDGIRDELIVWDKTIVDGHNRYKISKKHDLDFRIKQMDFDSKEDAINWMLSNQLGRRNLTQNQRIDVVFQAEELIKGIYEKGKSKARKGLEQGRLPKWKIGLSSVQENPQKAHDSSKKIAELADSNSSRVSSLKKVKKENPKTYKEVIDGKTSLYKAYNDLPSVTNKQAEREGFIKSGDKEKGVTKKTPIEKSEELQKQMPKLSDKEMKEQMFNANVITLVRHLAEVEGFIGRNEDYKKIIQESIKRDESSMQDYKQALQKIINGMGEVL